MRSSLASLMVADKISKIYAYGHGALWLSFNQNLQELADPF